MPTIRKPIRPYPGERLQAEKKYLPTFFLEFEYFGKMIKVEVRHLESDKGYYTIVMNGSFLAHIHKEGEAWADFLGKTSEMFQVVGN